MFKNLVRSIKKGKKADNGEQRSSTNKDIKFEKLNNDKKSPQLEHDEEWDETSGRRTPLLTWSASLDNLVNSCKNDKRTQNRRDNDSSALGAIEDADESPNNLDLTNLADEYKMGLRFDSPHLCSTGKKSADFKRLFQSRKEVADASHLMYESLKAEKYGDHQEYDLHHPVPVPRTSKSVSNRRSFSSTFTIDDQTSLDTSCQIRSKPHNNTYFKNCSKDFSQNLDYMSPCFTPESLKCISLAENMSLKSGLSSNDLNNTSKYALNSTEEGFVLSSTILADSGGVADEKERELSHVTNFLERTPRNHLYKPTHLFDIFSSMDTAKREAWTVVPLKFLHLDCLEPFILASDEFDQPLIFQAGSYKMLREGDRFLELNGLVVIQMHKRAILALFDSLPLGCTIRAVVLRKVVDFDANNNLSNE